MNLEHLRTFIWLRYRLRANQLKRAGVFNSVILAIIGVVCVFGSVILFAAGFMVGFQVLPKVPPIVGVLVWDGALVLFLFSWMVGLMAELQRTDALSLDKFFHLPVSPAGAFLVNYVSSLASVSLALFASGTIGLIIGQTISSGPRMLLALPLLAAFILAVTGITYQFQGWLASLMTNPRRRRTVIVAVTLAFILIFQLPNLINIIRPWKTTEPPPKSQFEERFEALNKSLQKREIGPKEYQRRNAELRQEQETETKAARQKEWDEAERTARIINAALPPAWLALGAADLARGSFLFALLGGVGFTSVAAFSLWRSYRTTLRMLTGSGQDRGAVRIRPTTNNQAVTQRLRLVEWKLPWISEHAATVAVAAFQSFIRAPEAKMALVAPVIMVIVFGSMLAGMKSDPPLAVRPLMAFGATSFVLLSAIQLIGNQFAYDRAGFRIFVLSPISRKDILLGKNLALAPFVLGMVALALTALECFRPMRFDLFLAALIQSVGMYFLFCLMANVVSILSPLPIAAGAMQPSQVKFTQIFSHLVMMMAYPLVLSPLLLPIGVELLLSEVTGIRFLPIALPMMIVLVACVLFIYNRGLTLLGSLLAHREQRVLEVVTSKLE